MKSLKGMHRLALKTTVRERLNSLYAAVKLAPGTCHSASCARNSPPASEHEHAQVSWLALAP
jgi:hypothetical protein